MACVDHVHIVVPWMLMIMNSGWEDHGVQVNIVQLSFVHPLASRDEVIHGLWDIRSMRFVVIGHWIVSCLDYVNES